MLYGLLRERLTPYRNLLAAVVALQFVGVVAMLYLPSLNADIIDRGVATGDTSYIIHTGAVMLGVTLLQVVCSVGAVWFGARTSMSLGRDLRAALFHRVGTFSAREVQDFGAPSLITRSTNDVTQVQMLVLMACTIAVSAPIMMVGGVFMALREDFGLGWILAVVVPALFLSVGFVVSRMVPNFRAMQARIDEVNRVLREQITGIRVVRAFVREPYEAQRFGTANDDLTEVAVTRRPLDGDDVPARDAGRERLQRRGDLVRRPPRRQRPDADRGADRVPVLPDADPDVGDDGDVHADDGAARLGLRRPDQRGARHPLVRRTARRAGDARPRASGLARPRARHVLLPGRRRTGAPRHLAVGAAGPDDRRDRVHRGGQVHAGQPGSAALRRDRGQRPGRRHRRTTARPGALWEQLGLVPQTAYLFSGTVRSNLLHGRPDATEEEIWAALEVAQARDFVEAMPDGLDATVAQGGTNFSGGQRQRLAIARALIRRPGIYLFDDSFSALDLATDARLRAALRADHDGRDGGDRRPAGHHDHRRRPDPRARGRPGGRPRHAPRAAG